ncbi:hypothetical protein 035JT004_284 [Bacillus phage 035JT004]|nr:hypothetical protein 035JT004_14 [Bacillus phage 035JT004]QZA69772.1 hypothetical protein 035JT004_284 [Bacillus phage 035JT004]
MSRLTYRIEEGKNCGNRRKTLYLIYVDGIESWKLPQLHRVKLFDGYYMIWSNDSAEEVLNDFVEVYGEYLEQELFLNSVLDVTSCFNKANYYVDLE